MGRYLPEDAEIDSPTLGENGVAMVGGDELPSAQAGMRKKGRRAALGLSRDEEERKET